MNSLIQMQAVMETPDYEDDVSCPWQIPEYTPFSMIRLFGEITSPEVGIVFAQLAEYNQIELANDKQSVLEQILEAESLVLPGGIKVISKDKSISPSCCCGLETWREWIMFLETGQSPWLGHDPSPWLERQGDLIRIWSDDSIEPVSRVFCIDVPRPDFERALILVERDLQAFLYSIESWAQDVGFARSNELSQKFDECFNIRRKYKEL